MQESPMPRRMDRKSLAALCFGSIGALLWSILAGVQHDYRRYLLQWKLVLAGENPWAGDNAYGPVHNLFAYFLHFGELTPKIMMVILFLAANAIFIQTLLTTKETRPELLIYILVIPTNFLTLIIAFQYGLNDTFVAALVMFAILARFKKLFITVGTLLGIASLVKFFPLFLIITFALNKRTIERKIIYAAIITFGLGMSLGYIKWGRNEFAPFRFGALRDANLMSVFNSIHSHTWLVGGDRAFHLLIRANFLLVLTGFLIALYFAYRLPMHWLEASTITLLIVLITYKVGNAQYYLTWLVLVAALSLWDDPWSRKLQRLFIPLALLLSFFQFSYTYLFSDDRTGFGLTLRANAGFIFFPLSLFLAGRYLLLRSREVRR